MPLASSLTQPHAWLSLAERASDGAILGGIESVMLVSFFLLCQDSVLGFPMSIHAAMLRSSLYS